MKNKIDQFIEILKTKSFKEILPAGKSLIAEFSEQQYNQFDKGVSVKDLLLKRSIFTDQLLTKLWQHFFSVKAQQCLTLFAVGGYGRRELQPYSDIDILIFGEDYEQYSDNIAEFITLLWDIGYEVGHAVRNLEQTIGTAKNDLSTATNLIEFRFIAGAIFNIKYLQNIWDNDDFWPSIQFFEAKLEEQESRHNRFQNTIYQLEPNIKESPGGLRDIHTILWIAKRHYKASSLQELVTHEFINQTEYEEIIDAYRYLNQVRFSLHKLKKRNENRLLLEHQQSLAEQQGLTYEVLTKSVEAFMKPYYKKIQTVAKLNEILIQHFKEEIFKAKEDRIYEINPRFNLVNNYLDAKKKNIFNKNPTALLEIFIILEDKKKLIQGIRSRTIRLIRNNLHLIDQQFRDDPINKALFLEIFRQPQGVTASLQRMHTYGILGAYLPAFQKVTGLMQFNIFHAYTVDEHTLLVIRNLRRFFINKFSFEFPTAHQVASQICKPDVLLLAGLFHDIAKGRQGVHEENGAVDAKLFGEYHNLSSKDTELLSWLVLKHLDFSFVAQKKDLSDPEVISDFAINMKSQERLDYLYLLTVADVVSTSPDVWNDWKNQLFLRLYNSTSQELDASITLPKSRAKLALLHREKAIEALNKRAIKQEQYQSLWSEFKNTEFFSRQNYMEIVRITIILIARSNHKIITSIAPKSQRGATELLILMEDRDFLFSQITKEIYLLLLNIVEAKIYTGTKGKTLVVVHLLDKNNEAIKDQKLIEQINETLQYELSLSDVEPTDINKKESRLLQVFDTETKISYQKIDHKKTELTIKTKDICGLLAKIGKGLKESKIRMLDAKINTVGEKVEDVFLISTITGKSLTLAQKENLTLNLLESIHS
jgi:[protein-PII] uridylyltransferase